MNSEATQRGRAATPWVVALTAIGSVMAALRESVELAFIAALQQLPARQRAVLILRDVLGFSAREVAETLETTPPAVDSALQRARRAADERLPERSQQAALSSLGDERLRKMVDGFVDAWERNDVDAVVAMLASDAAMTMPPLPTWYRGLELRGAADQRPDGGDSANPSGRLRLGRVLLAPWNAFCIFCSWRSLATVGA